MTRQQTRVFLPNVIGVKTFGHDSDCDCRLPFLLKRVDAIDVEVFASVRL